MASSYAVVTTDEDAGADPIEIAQSEDGYWRWRQGEEAWHGGYTLGAVLRLKDAIGKEHDDAR